MSDEIRLSDHAPEEVYAEATKTTDGYEMEIYKPDKVKVKGYTPNEQLRELIERAATMLREQEEMIYYERAVKTTPPIEESKAYELADELEALLDD